MVKLTINKHINNVLVMDRNVKFEEMKGFIEDILNDEISSPVTKQLEVWGKADEFKKDRVKDVLVHHKVWNYNHNYVSIHTDTQRIRFNFTDKQIRTLRPLLKELVDENSFREENRR